MASSDEPPRPRKRVRQYRRMARTRRRLADEQARSALRARLKDAYERGSSIRQLAKAHKLAFATVRTLLLEAGVTLRSRGGPNRKRRDAKQALRKGKQANRYRQNGAPHSN